jgi:DNA-binding NtrC family response regulator
MSPPGGGIEPEHLSPDLTAPVQPDGGPSTSILTSSPVLQPGNLAAAIESVERQLITTTLERTRGNISETARTLGLTRRGLYLKMARLGLDAVAADI